MPFGISLIYLIALARYLWNVTRFLFKVARYCYINLRGTVIPLIRLNEVLDVESVKAKDENLTVVIVTKGDKLAGFVVDNLIGQQEIVIKSIGKYINNSKMISGATILGDGEVALILDVNTLV